MATATVPSTSTEKTYRAKINWNRQQNHLLAGIKGLLEQDDLLLTDVTLACDGEYIEAHKLVLSLCSPFFKDLFIKNKADKANTIIILGHVSAINLKYLLQYIYQGTVQLPSKDVDGFLKAGKLLQIAGLNSTTQNPGPPVNSTSNPNHQSVSRPDTGGRRQTRRRLLRSSTTPVAEYLLQDDVSVVNEMDLNYVKTEPVQVSPGFSDNDQAEEISDDIMKNGEDSSSDSEDTTRNPKAGLISSEPVASTSSRRRPSTLKRLRSTEKKRSSERGRYRRKSINLLRRRQFAWSYFEKLESSKWDGYGYARCKLCSSDIKIHGDASEGSITPIRRHLWTVHNIQFEEKNNVEV